MSIRFIVGRAGTGKSRRCLDEIREELSREPDGRPLVLLVPEQSTFQAEYALISTPQLPGMMRAQVLSFRRLAWRVMQETGGAARIHIDDSGKAMLLYTILRSERDELRLFRSLSDQPGFVERLGELFTEFRRYGVTAEELAVRSRGALERDGASALFRQKLHDLLRVYSRFEAELARHYIDAEDDLALLAAQLEHSSYARSADVWIDGFHGFTPLEHAVIARLMQHCRRVSVAVTADRIYGAGEQPDELDLFHPTAVTLIRLAETAAHLGVDREADVLLEFGPGPERPAPRYADSPALAVLEACCASGASAPPPAWNEALRFIARSLNGQVAVREAANRRAEVDGAARDMIRLVRDKGARWKEMAVLVRDYEGYGELLAGTFSDYGIPFFFDRKRPLLHHPLVEFIRSAIETVTRNWRHDAIFRCVKTDMLLPMGDEAPEDGEEGSRIDRHAMDRLENFALAYGLQGTRWTDGKPWTFRGRADLEADGPSQREKPWERELLERCRERIVRPLLAFQRRLEKAACMRDMAEALFELLADVRAFERLQLWGDRAAKGGHMDRAREHEQIWDRIVGLLDQLALLMGHEPADSGLFAGLIESGLESLRLGLVPPSLDQVLIGSMDRTRSAQIRYAFVLGANDGAMPQAMSEDGVLSEHERDWLGDAGVELAPGSRRKLLDERFILYTALTLPSRRLWISYPLADEEGRTMLPSEIVKQLGKWLPPLKKATLALEPPPDSSANAAGEAEEPGGHLAYVAHPERTLPHLLVQLREWNRGSAISELWWEVYNWFVRSPEWQSKLAVLTGSLFYRNVEAPLRPATSRILYGDTLRTSVSRMETFAACPFSHFAAYGLRLEERPVFRLEAPDIGQLFHAALKAMTEELLAEGLHWGRISPAECEARASAAVDRLAPKLAGEILLSTSRFGYIARKLKRIVGRAAAVLGEHARRGAFVPVGLELGFGPDQPLPPLSFALQGGTRMEVVGRIDRVDRADSKRGVLLRVLDYKSSRMGLRLDEVYYGLSLQMLTYLDVVVANAERWLGAASRPAGVLYFHVHNPLLGTNGPISAEEAEKELFKRFKMRGYVLADPEAVRLMDDGLGEKGGRSAMIPAGIKANGEFYAGSSVADDRQWDTLRRFVRRKIGAIGRGLTQGKVDIAPYKLENRTPCGFCSYRPVCQFDRLQTGSDYRLLRPFAGEELWERLASEAEDETSERGLQE